MTTWPDYVALTRELESLQRASAQSDARQVLGRDVAMADIEQLSRRLPVQQQQLTRLGQILRQRVGGDTVAAAPASDPQAAITRAKQLADAVDAGLAETHRRAVRPALLPTLHPKARNAVVYSAFAAVSVLALYALLLTSDGARSMVTVVGWLCTGLPGLAWLGGLVTISVWGRPRMGDGSSVRSPLLGLVICGLAMPVALCAFELVNVL